MVQGLGLSAFTAEGPGSVPGWGTKILQASRRGQKKKKDQWKRDILTLLSSLPVKGALLYLGAEGPLSPEIGIWG